MDALSLRSDVMRLIKIRSPRACAKRPSIIISHKVILKSFCRSQHPHKSVNLSLTITNLKNKLTDLCGN